MALHEVTNRDIYTGIAPFVGLQIMALMLVYVAPGLAT